MSPDARRQAWLLGGALLLGVLANLVFGASPGKVKPLAAANQDWKPVAMRVPDLAMLDTTWEARAPWGAVPKPVEPPAPPPPPPVPVGIVGTGAARQAIFLIHGSGELRLGVGGTLPDGGQVLEISAMKVAWVDGNGARHERRMFLDPVELPAGAVPAASQGPAVAPQGMPAIPGGTPPPGGVPPSPARQRRPAAG